MNGNLRIGIRTKFSERFFKSEGLVKVTVKDPWIPTYL